MALYNYGFWDADRYGVQNGDSFIVTLTIEDGLGIIEETDEERFVRFVHEAQERWLTLQREALSYQAGGTVE